MHKCVFLQLLILCSTLQRTEMNQRDISTCWQNKKKKKKLYFRNWKFELTLWSAFNSTQVACSTCSTNISDLRYGHGCELDVTWNNFSGEAVMWPAVNNEARKEFAKVRLICFWLGLVWWGLKSAKKQMAIMIITHIATRS